MHELDERADAFVDELTKLVDGQDRGALAALRRGLGKPPGSAFEMYPFVVGHAAGLGPREQDACFLVAALFTIAPTGTREQRRVGARPRHNLGATMREVRAKTDAESTERRFTALLNCHVDDLPNHLRHAVALAASHEVPIDWKLLLRDLLRRWGNPGRYIQRQWARGYWGGTDAAETTDTDDTDTDDTDTDDTDDNGEADAQ